MAVNKGKIAHKPIYATEWKKWQAERLARLGIDLKKPQRKNELTTPEKEVKSIAGCEKTPRNT
jgi:hypothetical protein